MTSPDKTPPAAASAPITGMVPMIHVADVDRSAAFYRLLGFAIGNFVPPTGTKQWAWLYAPDAPDWKRGPNLMLTRSECALDAPPESFLFYLYAADLKAMRATLLENGIDAGEIVHPEYLPEGEFGVQDPDGYCLMIAQSTPETP